MNSDLFYFRLISVSLWFFLISLLGIPYSLFRWGNLNIDHQFARLYSWGARKLLNIRVEVEGREHLNSQPCIYIANHQSNLDLVTFGILYPQRTIVIGKKEVLWIPFFGLFFAAAGNIRIDRQKRVKAIAGLAQAVEAIRKKAASIWIFPEGTRNKSGEGLLPFKKGAFHMAFQANVPLVPIVSSSLNRIANWERKIMTGGVIKIRVLPAIHLQGIQEEDLQTVCERTREQMLEALRGLST